MKRKRMFLALLLVGAGLVVPVASATASGYCPASGDSCISRCTTWYWHVNGNHWYDGSFPIQYFINQNGTADTGGEFAAVERAALTWGTQAGSYFPTCYSGTTVIDTVLQDGVNTVHWTTSSYYPNFGGCGPGYSMARAYWWHADHSDSLVEADIVFNDRCTWQALVADSVDSGKYDVQSVAAHEFGHWLSADHSCCEHATMYCYVSTGDASHRTLEPEDRSCVSHYYSHVPGRPIRNPGCWPASVAGFPTVYSSPAVGDIDNDGRKEILCACAGMNNQIAAVDANAKTQPGFPVNINPGSFNSLVSTPLLCNANGDSMDVLEIFVGGGNNVYGFNGSGNALPGWPVATGGLVVSSPAGGDIDGDGVKEIVAGSADGKVYAWNGNGTAVNGWPVNLGSAVYSSPALADLDGGGLDVIIGCDNDSVYAFNGNGTRVTGWPRDTGHPVRSSPVVGDIDDDGDYEVVALSDSSVYAWHHTGVAVNGFPRRLPSDLGVRSAALADLNGDGDLEILVPSNADSLYVLDHQGNLVSGWPKAFTNSGTQACVPVAGDIDGDGNVEVIVAAGGDIQAFRGNGTALGTGWPIQPGGYPGRLALDDMDGDGRRELAYTQDNFPLWDWDLGGANGKLEWGSFRHDRCNTGRYGYVPPDPAVLNFHFSNSFDGSTWPPPGWHARFDGSSIVDRDASSSVSPPYSLRIQSPDPGPYNYAYLESDSLSLDMERPYSLSFFFRYTDHLMSSLCSVGQLRLFLGYPGEPLYLDLGSGPVPVGPPLADILPPGTWGKIEGTVYPDVHEIHLIVNSEDLGSFAYSPSLDALGTLRLGDDHLYGEGSLAAFYDDVDLLGAETRAVTGVRGRTPPSPGLFSVTPNPTRGAASILFPTRFEGRVRIQVFDVSGRRVRALWDDPLPAGFHRIPWDGRDDQGRRVTPGLYFVRLQLDGMYRAGKLVVVY